MTEYNIPDHTRGDTYPGLDFEVIINGSAKPLASTDIKIEFRQGSKTGSVMKTLTNGSGITVTDAPAGKFRIDAFLVSFPPGKYYYDVQFKDGSVIKTYIYGAWVILQDVTS
jgi:hypothetical protein